MPARTLVIGEVIRQGADVKEERLQFRSGMNVLVGAPNTGKTKWMETLDFLLGDNLSAEQRETDDIFVKFDSASMTALIGGQEFKIVRKWKEKGALTKVFVNDAAISLEDYNSFLLAQLGIVPFQYPQGNPYGSRSWPELGWRSLVRHIYRRQTMWSDLADKQPPAEQHACLLQFLGAAHKVFSADFGSLVEKQKQLTTLHAQRDNFMQMLQDISHELMDAEELSVALTPQSIGEAEARLETEEEKLQEERESLLLSLRKQSVVGLSPSPDVVQELTERLVRLQGDQESSLTALQKVNERKRELEEYREILGHELSRLERAVESGNLLADLRVTHCPACDQEVSKTAGLSDRCYVCKQPLSVSGTTSGVGRVQFEVEQIQGEGAEMDELLHGLQSEIENVEEHLRLLSEEITQTQQLLRPVRSAAAAILPPELAIGDMSIGRLQEKRNQLQRVKTAFERRELISQSIKSVQMEIDRLSGAVSEQTGDVDYQSLGDRLGDGMNSYLNKLNQAHGNAWSVGEVSVRLQERSIKIRVGKADWHTKLGGTLTLYFLLSYQYALLDLVRFPESRFPGLLLVDFPAELEGTNVADKENFVVEPFIELLSKKGMDNCQMIAAGSAFVGLRNAARIQLSHVWKG